MNFFKFWHSLLVPVRFSIVELDGAGSDMPIVDDSTPEPTEEGQTAQPQPSAYEFNPDNYGVIFRGEKVVPKDRTHLEELLQMGHSYNTNKDKWTSLESEHEKLKQQWEQYDQLNKELLQHPELANQFQSVYQQYMQGQGQAQPQQQGQIDPVYQQRLDQIEQKLADDALNSELNKVMQNHSEHDWNKDTGEGSLRIQLLKFMQKTGINDPEHAYRAMMFPTATEKAKFDAARQTTEAIKGQHRRGIVSQGTAAPPAPGGWNPQGKTYDQAEEAGLAMLQQMRK